MIVLLESRRIGENGRQFNRNAQMVDDVFWILTNSGVLVFSLSFLSRVCIGSIHTARLSHAWRYIFLLSLSCLFTIMNSPNAFAQAPEKKLAAAESEAAKNAADEASKMEDADKSGEKELHWFILPALVNVYPKLDSEDLIRQYYNPAMRFVAPDFKNVRTIGSLRDEHILWTPDFGIGRVVSKHWALYIHLGYSGGRVRTKERHPSIIAIPFQTDFQIYRSAAYLGLCADYFPLGMPIQTEYHGLLERLRNAKPTIGLRLTETYAGYQAKVKAKFGDMPNFLNLELNDDWWVPTFNANIGADIPLDEKSTLSLNFGYNIAFKRGYDFDGPEFTVGWKRFFK
jgi:hypothetical protein